jgi:hypothetical protein
MRKQKIKFGIDRFTGEYRQLKRFEFLRNGKIYKYKTYIKNCEICDVEFETTTLKSRTDSSKCDAELKFQIWSRLFEQDKILASQNYNKSQYTQTVKKYFERKYYYELYVAKITPCCKLNINLLANQGKNTYNGKLCIMNIDHIDNNPSNNKYSNLQYICLFCHAVKTDYRRNIGSNGRLNIVRKELKKLNSLKKTDYSGRGMKLEMEVK